MPFQKDEDERLLANADLANVPTSSRDQCKTTSYGMYPKGKLGLNKHRFKDATELLKNNTWTLHNV